MLKYCLRSINNPMLLTKYDLNVNILRYLTNNILASSQHALSPQPALGHRGDVWP